MHFFLNIDNFVSLSRVLHVSLQVVDSNRCSVDLCPVEYPYLGCAGLYGVVGLIPTATLFHLVHPSEHAGGLVLSSLADLVHSLSVVA